MSPVFQAAIVMAILVSPFAGCFAAALVRASLAGAPVLRCRSCGYKLKGGGLIPLFSLSLGMGACHKCRAPISLLYPGTGAAFLAAALWASRIGPLDLILPGMLLGWALIVLFLYDVTAFVLPNVLTYSLLVSGLGLAAATGRPRWRRVRPERSREGLASSP